ncbi:thiol-disulfide oxidoreductase DCC family protein [Kaistella sp.]|uniref:thiol-disulfide oxidoreductase DCC family protein n=1 Tax=Kaistella sp. TaxID=2782235 RepID=UPI002F94C322
MTDSSKYYVFYDGDCGMCNYWVQWILKNDHRKQFLFSALQSEFGQKFLNERNLENQQLNTLYLWKPNAFYETKSHAVFKIAKILGGKFKILSYLRVLPSTLTDFLYETVAKHRHKIATQKCFLPSPEERRQFLY